MTRRLVIDLSSLVQWHGPMVGIPRVQRNYAAYARYTYPDTIFTVFDPRTHRYRPIREAYVDGVLDGSVRTYMGDMPIPGDRKRRSIDRVPKAMRPAYWWATRFRRKLVLSLEDGRLTSEGPRAAMIGRLQDRLIASRHRALFHASDGTRLRLPSLDRMTGEALDLAPDHVTLGMQSDWTHTDIASILAARDRAGSRHVVLCHDIIPLKFPEWYAAHDVASFKAYYDQALPGADRLIFTSRRTVIDAARYCEAERLKLADHRVVPLGSDPFQPRMGADRLPAGLEAGRFAMFISTIEPRKNHRMLVDAWRRLVASGLIAETGFRLVFVGREGWMMDGFLDEVKRDAALAGSVVHLAGIDDETLAGLYRSASFCLYPPLYEGFGLPPIEALQNGKALIASSGGPMPEIIGEFGVCIDPRDTDAWAERMAAWIGGAPEREAYAAKARDHYKAVTWEDSARLFFEAVLS